MQRLITIVLALAMLLGLTMTASVAAVPRLINYQGVLTDVAGVAIEGPHDLTFKVYADSLASGATWTEVHTGVVLSRGMFNVILGGLTAITDALFADSSLWLGITLDTEPETAPRMRLTSVPWAMKAALADAVVGGGIGESLWQANGADVYRAAGSVGIGKASPTDLLDMEFAENGFGGATVLNTDIGDLAASRILLKANSAPSLSIGRLGANSAAWPNYGRPGESFIYNGSLGKALNVIASDVNNGRINFYVGNSANYTPKMTIGTDGNIGIGTATPEGLLDIRSGPSSAYYKGIHYGHNGTAGGAWIGSTSPSRASYSAGAYYHVSGYWTPQATSAGILDINSGVLRYYANTSLTDGVDYAPTARMIVDASGNMTVTGRTTTSVLEITGGADLAEPFSTAAGEEMPKGALVAINEQSPGNVRLTRQTYDNHVVGVVSGANGISTGLSLNQEELTAGGQPVALAGRVYCLATTENGPIRPGDMLTSSTEPGHAMRASDHDRSYGAVIGKAMSALEDGTGFVLVLVQPK